MKTHIPPAEYIKNVIGMAETECSYLTTKQQLQESIESGPVVLKKTLIHDRIDYCLEIASATASPDFCASIDEIKMFPQWL